MTHDSLCTTVLNTEMSEAFCDCDLIARVREDEREACAQTVLADGLHSVYPTITEMLADAIRARGEKP